LYRWHIEYIVLVYSYNVINCCTAAHPLLPIIPDEHVRSIQEGLKSLTKGLLLRQNPPPQTSQTSNFHSVVNNNGGNAAQPGSSNFYVSSSQTLPNGTAVESRFSSFDLPNLATNPFQSLPVVFPIRNGLFQQLSGAASNNNDDYQFMSSIRPMSGQVTKEYRFQASLMWETQQCSCLLF
jgi:hypothetical protein